jgi:hypothetical protein
MEGVCPTCHLKLDRGEADYFIGAFTVNFVTAEMIAVTGAGIGVWLTWPDVPWTALKWGLLAAMIPAPIFFYPFAKTIWLAMDLTFRPLTLADLEGHGENLGATPGRPEAGPDGPASEVPADFSG